MLSNLLPGIIVYCLLTLAISYPISIALKRIIYRYHFAGHSKSYIKKVVKALTTQTKFPLFTLFAQNHSPKIRLLILCYYGYILYALISVILIVCSWFDQKSIWKISAECIALAKQCVDLAIGWFYLRSTSKDTHRN